MGSSVHLMGNEIHPMERPMGIPMGSSMHSMGSTMHPMGRSMGHSIGTTIHSIGRPVELPMEQPMRSSTARWKSYNVPWEGITHSHGKFQWQYIPWVFSLDFSFPMGLHGKSHGNTTHLMASLMGSSMGSHSKYNAFPGNPLGNIIHPREIYLQTIESPVASTMHPMGLFIAFTFK